MLTPSAFCESAGFPPQWKEVDLQDYIAQRLRDRGFKIQMEVSVNGGRADIVSDWMDGSIIEVKKYLDRNSIFQASGQLNLYGLKNNRKLVVMGLLTPDAREQQSAITTASMIQQDPRVTVIFCNTSEEWLPNSKAGIKLPGFNFKFPVIPQLNDWKWWFNLVKAHPLLLMLAIAIFMGGVVPTIQQQTQVNQVRAK